MKSIKKLILRITLCVMATSTAYSADMVKTSRVDKIPDRYAKEASQRGVVDTLTYDVTIDGKVYSKQALVYLPYGYNPSDKTKRYNVLYLTHGGGDNPGSWFSSDRTHHPLNQVADHLVEDGLMDPIIIVSATYYPPASYSADKSMDNTISYCRHFHKELRGNIIPAVGKRYNTYLKAFDDASITASRKHRAFGGFSMGSLTTWFQLAGDPDAVANYLPFSGDLWTYDEEGKKLPCKNSAKWLNDQIAATPYRGSDFNILAYTGDKDIAYVPELELISELAANSPYLKYSDDINSSVNLHFSVMSGADHSYYSTSQYLSDALPRLWKKLRLSPYWLGADISSTTAMEARGAKFFNAAGKEMENTSLMKDLGLNAVRLRVWVDPKNGFSNKEDVLTMAKRAKENGMEIMIIFHYSDSWADPGKQNIPAKWKNYNYSQMKKALAQHTDETLRLLKKNGINVKWVQIGNETTHGMLWDMGRAETNMKQYAGLNEAGYKAAKNVYPDAICFVHLDCGADLKRYQFIFDGLEKYGSPYDMIGMSVYPYWDMQAKRAGNDDETIAKVTDNILTLSKKYGKPLIIAETGYEALRPNEGYAFLRKLMDATYPIEECKGVFYWAPESEGYYPLGAFEKGRPTRIMDAYTEYATGAAASDTTFFSTRDIDVRTPNGIVRGTLMLPYTSQYMKDGKLPVVILSHGFNGTFRETQAYAEALASNGIAAYNFDFYGGSSFTKSEGKTTEMSVYTELADLEAVTCMLERMPNIDKNRIMLLGCSQGALVSTMTASENPGRYNALMLMYPALGIPQSATQMLEQTKDTPEEFPFWDTKLSQKYYRSIKGINGIGRLRTFDGPVLMVYGEKDDITPGETAEAVKANVKNANVHMIAKGTHGFPDSFAHRESEAHLLRFVKKILSK